MLRGVVLTSLSPTTLDKRPSDASHAQIVAPDLSVDGGLNYGNTSSAALCRSSTPRVQRKTQRKNRPSCRYRSHAFLSQLAVAITTAPSLSYTAAHRTNCSRPPTVTFARQHQRFRQRRPGHCPSKPRLRSYHAQSVRADRCTSRGAARSLSTNAANPCQRGRRQGDISSSPYILLRVMVD